MTPALNHRIRTLICCGGVFKGVYDRIPKCRQMYGYCRYYPQRYVGYVPSERSLSWKSALALRASESCRLQSGKQNIRV